MIEMNNNKVICGMSDRDGNEGLYFFVRCTETHKVISGLTNTKKQSKAVIDILGVSHEYGFSDLWDKLTQVKKLNITFAQQ